MRWYLVYTKPRQEKLALAHLTLQGYECYLPMRNCVKLRKRKLVVVNEPLFSRYLFIRLGNGSHDKNWVPIRSTVGVCELVRFGVRPAQAEDALIEKIKRREEFSFSTPEPLPKPSEKTRYAERSTLGVEAVFQMHDGRERVLALIALLSKPTKREEALLL